MTSLRPDGVVKYELRESVAWLGLNRPQKRNAIDNGLLAALQDSVTRAQAEAKAAVIFGHGPCFSSGLDLAEHRARGAEEAFHHSRAGVPDARTGGERLVAFVVPRTGEKVNAAEIYAHCASRLVG
jgi:enoyl-CoA hydratase/carnithine racemase